MISKRFAAVFVCLLCIFAAGCGKSPGVTAGERLSPPLKITASCGNAVFACRIGEDRYEAEYLEPETLRGMTIASDGAGTGFGCGDFRREAGENDFPAVGNLVKAIRAVGSGKMKESELPGALEYAIDEMKILVYYEGDGKIITDIITEGAGGRYEYRVLSAEQDEGTGDGTGRSFDDTP